MAETDIQLPGYNAVYLNQVYSKDYIVTCRDMSGKEVSVPVKKIIIPRIFNQPTEQEAIEHIQKKAEELEGAASLILTEEAAVAQKKSKSRLEFAIMGLPEPIRRDLKKGANEKMTKFLRENISAPRIEKENPVRYLRVRYGVLPENIISRYYDVGEIKEAMWYDAALSNDALLKAGFGLQWNARILLESGMPNKEEMITLIKHQVHGSRTLNITAGDYNPKEASEAIKAVLDGIKTEQLSLLADVSKLALEDVAMELIAALYTLIAASQRR